MRLKAAIWVKAYLRICHVNGAFAAVVRHGDDDAGAIFIRINCLDGTSRLMVPAPAGLDGTESQRCWQPAFANAAGDGDVESYLAREAGIDGDLWIIEVESRDGEHFLGDQVTE